MKECVACLLSAGATCGQWAAKSPGCYSSVMYTCWTTAWVPGKERIFLSAATSRPALVPMNHPTVWQSRVLSSWVKQLDNAVDHSASSSANIYLYPLYNFMAQCTDTILYILLHIITYKSKLIGTCKVKMFQNVMSKHKTCNINQWWYHL
jgi:hypothetical protein